MVASSKNGTVEVRCDKCGRHAPAPAEIMAGHGLNNMGWRCSGGTHLCPDCKPAEEATR